MCAEEPNRGAACSESRSAGSDSGSTLSSRSRADKGKARRSRSARGVVSGSDGYNQTAPGVRKARAAATSPATLCAPPNRAVHPDCARTHRHGRDCVASPWALERARRHQPLPHPLGACRARHQMVAELHSALHRPFQESAPTRPVGRACPPQRPRTNAAVPITRFGSSVSDPRWPHPALREKRSHPRAAGRALHCGQVLDEIVHDTGISNDSGDAGRHDRLAGRAGCIRGRPSLRCRAVWRLGSSSSALITGPTRLNPRGRAQAMHVETPTLDDASLPSSSAEATVRVARTPFARASGPRHALSSAPAVRETTATQLELPRFGTTLGRFRS